MFLAICSVCFVDINECALGIDNCAEVCMNVYGSHYCSCNDSGYGVNSDGITCSGETVLDLYKTSTI